MKKTIETFIVCLIVIFVTAENGISASGNEEHFLLAPNVIAMPLGKILLVRNHFDYGAIRFSRFWVGNSQDDQYASYEAYYQGDKTGDFSNKNVTFTKGDLHDSKPSFSIFGHPIAFGQKVEIRCGPIRLLWSGMGTVYFFGSRQTDGDYGIELALTKWTDISQVNVFDPRLEWYRYNEKRKVTVIPVDQLWRDEEDKKPGK